MHIPLGLALDRLPVKWVIAVTISLSVIGLVPLALSDQWLLSVIGRFLVGAGSSGAILSVFKVTRLYFPDHWFSRLLGISVTIGLLGAMYGSTPVDRLSGQWGWETILLAFVVLGVVIAFAVLLWAPRNSMTEDNHEGIWQEIRVVLTNGRVLWTAFFAALMVGPMEGFADVWAVSFLETVNGYERTVATSLPSMIFLGMCVGCPVLAALAEKHQAYYSVTIISALGMAAAFAVLLMIKSSPIVVGILFFIVGIFSAYQVLVMYMNSKNADERYNGLVTAVTNMIIMVFGSVFHFVIGHVMNMYWDGKIINNLAIYNAESYIYGIAVIPIALIIALVGFVFLKPRKG
jgi:predicted MFS family arabinose efflux permease